MAVDIVATRVAAAQPTDVLTGCQTSNNVRRWNRTKQVSNNYYDEAGNNLINYHLPLPGSGRYLPSILVKGESQSPRSSSIAHYRAKLGNP